MVHSNLWSQCLNPVRSGNNWLKSAFGVVIKMSLGWILPNMTAGKALSSASGKCSILKKQIKNGITLLTAIKYFKKKNITNQYIVAVGFMVARKQSTLLKPCDLGKLQANFCTYWYPNRTSQSQEVLNKCKTESCTPCLLPLKSTYLNNNDTTWKNMKMAQYRF